MKERSTGWELGDLIYQEHQSWAPAGDVSEPYLISQLQVEMGWGGEGHCRQGSRLCKGTGVCGERGGFRKPHEVQGQ